MNREVRRHNETVLETLEEGDLVEIDKGIYSHWGVSMGDETIVHLTGDNYIGTTVDSSLSNVLTYRSGMNATSVKREKVLDVAGNYRMKKNNNKDGIRPPLTGGEIKEKALSKIGKTSYSLFWDNCEHFAAECRNGISRSNQADTGFVCSLGLGLMAAARVFAYKADAVKSLCGVGGRAFIDVGRRLFYAACTCEKADATKNFGSMVTRTLINFGRRFYSGYPGINVGRMTYVIKENVGLERLFPGNEMMRTLFSILPFRIEAVYTDYFVNAIPVFKVKTALIVTGSVVAAVVTAVVAVYVAYKLYVHREQIARGIKNCCSFVANGIHSLYGKLFSW